MSSFESLESFRHPENLEESHVESLNESIWKSPEFESRELSENIDEGACDLSKNLIDEYLEKHERLHDSDVASEIASELENMEDLRYENWVKLSEDQKLKLLNKVEETQSVLEHRDKMIVELEDLPKGTFGYQDADTNRIVLNRSYVLSDDPVHHRESVDTVIHEGRHAYQHYNVDVRTIHESDAEVASWRENFYDPGYGYYQSQGRKLYILLEDGSIHELSDKRLYEYQPVEVDARNFASDVMDKLDKQGLFAPNSKLDS